MSTSVIVLMNAMISGLYLAIESDCDSASRFFHSRISVLRSATSAG